MTLTDDLTTVVVVVVPPLWWEPVVVVVVMAEKDTPLTSGRVPTATRVTTATTKTASTRKARIGASPIGICPPFGASGLESGGSEAIKGPACRAPAHHASGLLP